jgi:hypothetical protein
MSLIGLLVIIGALGFVPFFTAATFTANSIEAYFRALEVMGGLKLMASAILGALLVIAVPVAVQTKVSLVVWSAIRDVSAGDPTALPRLRAWYRFGPRDSLPRSYFAEWDPVRKQRLADACKDLTGEDVNLRLARVVD